MNSMDHKATESSSVQHRRILVGVTGASGSIYAERLIETLLAAGVGRVYVVATESGEQVVRHELSASRTVRISLPRILSGELTDAERTVIRVFKNDDLFAPVASGSSAPTDMIVVPCSMGTLGRIANGISGCLLERAADVMLKQRRRLVIVPRETPLHAIHLQNLLTLAQMGTAIVPPSPGFYQKPKTIDDMVDFVTGRILEVLDIPHELYQKWNPRMM